jgi:hypothetical protein
MFDQAQQGFDQAPFTCIVIALGDLGPDPAGVRGANRYGARAAQPFGGLEAADPEPAHVDAHA